MALILKQKPALDAFIQTCTPLAIIEPLEGYIQQRVEAIASGLLAIDRHTDPATNLANLLQSDQDFLGIILALTNLSQEKFLRILSAERFAQGDFAPEWGSDRVYKELQRDTAFALRVAHLFIEGKQSSALANQIAAFYLEQLGLPQEWEKIIVDPQIMRSLIRRKLSGEYSDRKGEAIEGIIREHLNDITEKYGLTHTKGQVSLLGLGKEIDHIIPSTDDPYVMIMASYMETTSSSQTARANEQMVMFSKIETEFRRYGKNRRVFVNFVDGAGWLARRSDLRKLYSSCDYILNLKTLSALEAIVCAYVPEKYFTKHPKPQVIE